MKRAKEATAQVAETQRLAAEFAQITREAVREMRLTMSLNEVAKVLNVSRTRVRQLQGPGEK